MQLLVEMGRARQTIHSSMIIQLDFKLGWQVLADHVLLGRPVLFKASFIIFYLANWPQPVVVDAGKLCWMETCVLIQM